MRYQVLTATSMKMIVFWEVAPRSLVEICRFKGLAASVVRVDIW
jgi:hypothetical protein